MRSLPIRAIGKRVEGMGNARLYLSSMAANARLHLSSMAANARLYLSSMAANARYLFRLEYLL